MEQIGKRDRGGGKKEKYEHYHEHYFSVRGWRDKRKKMMNLTAFIFWRSFWIKSICQFITTSPFFPFHRYEPCVFCCLAAIISSHASFFISASVFTLPVYSGEMKNDLRQEEEGGW